MVFKNLQLKNFGNRIPNITVQISFKVTNIFPGVVLSAPGSGIVDIVGQQLAYDFRRRKAYIQESIFETSDDAIILSRIDVPFMIEKKFVTKAQSEINISVSVGGSSTGLIVRTVDPITGFLYGDWAVGDTFNDSIKVKVDPNSLVMVQGFPNSFKARNLGTDNRVDQFRHNFRSGMTTMNILGETGILSVLICSGTSVVSPRNRPRGLLNTSDMSYLWGVGRDTDEATTGMSIHTIAGKKELGTQEAIWVLTQNLSDPIIVVYKARVAAFAVYTGPFAGVDAPDVISGEILLQIEGGTIGVTELSKIIINLSDLEAADSSLTGITGIIDDGQWVYDPDSNSIIGQFEADVPGLASDQSSRVVSFNADTGSINWLVKVLSIFVQANQQGDSSYNIEQTNHYVPMCHDAIVILDKFTGETIFQLDDTVSTYNANWADTSNYGSIYIPDLEAVIGPRGFPTLDGFSLLFLNRAGGAGVTLKSIIDDLSFRAGLEVFEIDTNELADTEVKGYTVSRQTSVRGAIEPLISAFFFDGIESDYKVKFLDRGRNVTLNIAQDDLVRSVSSKTNEFFKQNRIQEQEMPMRFNVSFINKDFDYQQGTQTSKRAQSPFPTMESRNDLSITLPIVLTAEEAKQISEKSLYVSWVERDNYQTRIPWTFLGLDPADIITITLDDGSLFKTRITALDLGADLSLNLEGVSEDTTTYTSTAIGQIGVFQSGELLGGTNASFLIVHNLPLLSDLHDTLRTKSIIYFQAGPLFGGSGWVGATIFQSTDNSNFTEIGRSVDEMAYGTTSNALGSPPSGPFAIDFTNTLTIFPTVGDDQLESISDIALLEGSLNMMVVGVEVINFRDAVDNGDGSFTLSVFLRGRRGTDTVVEDHVIGEQFSLLTTDTTQAFSIALADIGTPMFFKAVGDGETFEEAQIIIFTPTGEDLKPYAPVNAVRVDDTPAAGDITISWDRRTRINGDFLDNTGTPPLEEDTESYEVDILDGTGGSVLRTLASTSESVEYDTADIATDFGSPPATLFVRIYQLSVQVGRGKNYEFALT